jgi:DNA invertase Pin-like site-specific DNA recombinase
MIYAYYRVSSADQNYNSQKLGVEEYCKRCGYHIDKEVIDDGISGTVKAKDRHLWKIVKEAQKDDWVITSELSRIGRSTTDVLQTLNTLAKKGVNVYFVKQGMQLDQSPMGKMMTAILSAFAEMERDLISQRTVEGIERARKEGKHIGRPFGSKNKVFKLKEEEVRACREAGMNKSQIARYFGIYHSTVIRYMKMWGIA